MTVFTMFFIELMAARFDLFGSKAHDLEASDPSLDIMRQSEKFHDSPVGSQKGLFAFNLLLRVFLECCMTLIEALAN